MANRGFRFMFILLSGGAFGALVSPVLGVTLFAITRGLSIEGIFGGALAWAYLLVGPFGMLLGLICGIWLGIVAERTNTLGRFAVSAGIFGAVLGTAFAGLLIVIAAVRGTGVANAAMALSIGAATGALTSAAYAAIFHRVFLRSNEHGSSRGTVAHG